MASISAFKLEDGSEIRCASSSSIESSVASKGFTGKLELRNLGHSDLESGVYEGGFKVWEGALDLCEFLNISNDLRINGKNVCELGCGAGLPSILALKQGASSVTFQDFNESVIECFTKENCVLNDIPKDKCRFFAGSWIDCQSSLKHKSYDLIFTTETIYNEKNYLILLDTFDKLLTQNGQIFLASKVYYFGVGGNINEFLDVVKKHGKFQAVEVFSKRATVPRKILLLTRIG